MACEHQQGIIGPVSVPWSVNDLAGLENKAENMTNWKNWTRNNKNSKVIRQGTYNINKNAFLEMNCTKMLHNRDLNFL